MTNSCIVSQSVIIRNIMTFLFKKLKQSNCSIVFLQIYIIKTLRGWLIMGYGNKIVSF